MRMFCILYALRFVWPPSDQRGKNGEQVLETRFPTSESFISPPSSSSSLPTTTTPTDDSSLLN